jgi:hypothetical protein
VICSCRFDTEAEAGAECSPPPATCADAALMGLDNATPADYPGSFVSYARWWRVDGLSDATAYRVLVTGLAGGSAVTVYDGDDCGTLHQLVEDASESCINVAMTQAGSMWLRVSGAESDPGTVTIEVELGTCP